MSLSVAENELITRVGPGTPGGEMMRRYWHPIGFTSELKGRPLRRRLLGEDLVLFRDDHGQLGILDSALPASRHVTGVRPYRRRRPALLLSRLAVQHRGQDSANARRARGQHLQRAHQAKSLQGSKKLGGIIFAYLGPEPAPLLPRWDVLVRADGVRALGWARDPLQFLADGREQRRPAPFQMAAPHAEDALVVR